MFNEALLTIAKTWKQPKRPFTESRTEEMWYRYTVKYYLAIKKNEIMPFAVTWTDLETVMLSKLDKDKHHMILLNCGVFKKR